MQYFVSDIKDGSFNIDISLARKIYQCLNKSEQDEVELWLERNPKMGLNDVIRILYGTLSQRRRMNPRLVKAVDEFNRNNKSNLVVTEINDEVKYIEVNFNYDNSEYIMTYKEKEDHDCEDISMWIEQKSVAYELKNDDKDFNPLDDIVANELKFKDIVRITINKFRRWLYSLTHKEVKRFNKQRGVRNGRRKSI